MSLYQFEKKPHGAFRGGEFPFDKRYLEVAVVVGDRIRRLRLDRDVTLIDLARRVRKPAGGGYSASYFSRLERGWANAPLYTYHQIARALEVDPWILFASDEARHDPNPGEVLLLRFLRRAGIAPDDALARIVSPEARPAR
ncbi:MAG: helix-turn-helix transcriptional regulator [Thermoleophilaceae bacterium]